MSHGGSENGTAILDILFLCMKNNCYGIEIFGTRNEVSINFAM
jgi:hypothetical protein